MARNMKNVQNRETHTVGPGKQGETVKNVKNEICTLEDMEFGEKIEKRG